ncbi:MAG: type IV pilin protein [Candidatus Rokuibacteriota bacterium]
MTSIIDACRRWTTRHARQSHGLTLVELMIVLAIIGTLASIATPLYVDVQERARVARAIAEIRILDGEIAAFEGVNGRLPDSLAEMGRGALEDPWGNPYEFLNFETGGTGKILRPPHVETLYPRLREQGRPADLRAVRQLRPAARVRPRHPGLLAGDVRAARAEPASTPAVQQGRGNRPVQPAEGR